MNGRSARGDGNCVGDSSRNSGRETERLYARRKFMSSRGLKTRFAPGSGSTFFLMTLAAPVVSVPVFRTMFEYSSRTPAISRRRSRTRGRSNIPYAPMES